MAIQPRLLSFFVLLFAVFMCNADTAEDRLRNRDREHTRAVELGRAGKYEESLAILDRLILNFPEEYPLHRDRVLITIWKGDCKQALRHFGKVRNHDHPPYLLVPVSDCMLEQGRTREAVSVARVGLDRHADNVNLQHAFLKTTLALDAERPIDENRPAVAFEFITNESDQGLREWLGRLEGSVRIAERTRLYARHSIARSDETGLEGGDYDRAGVGVRFRFNEQLLLDQEFSADTKHSEKSGAATTVLYEPRDTWRFTGRYTTFAEDLPLRARAAGVEGKHGAVSAEYNSVDYIWYGFLALNRYDFSDTNRRQSIFGSLGHTFEMLPYREQAVYAELYGSRNTFDGAPYFNPRRDRSLGLVHRTSFVFDSRHKRHVDSLFLGIASYWQESFGSHGTWSVRYEQDYDFDNVTHLSLGLAYAANVYDAQREYETRVELRFLKSF